MKKRLLFVLLISLGLLTLVGCGKNKESESGYSLTFDGVKIVPGETIDMSKFKKEYDTFEEPDCALGGKGYNYTFEELEISATEKGKVYSIYFIDPNLKTDEGIALGDSVSDVKKAYGDKDVKDNMLSYEKAKVELNFTIESDMVTGIEYRYTGE